MSTLGLLLICSLPFSSAYAHSDIAQLLCQHHFYTDCLLDAIEIGDSNPTCRCVLFIPPFGNSSSEGIPFPMLFYGDLMHFRSFLTRAFF
jgi:hypothetical protein